jgi:hypothetical protein
VLRQVCGCERDEREREELRCGSWWCPQSTAGPGLGIPSGERDVVTALTALSGGRWTVIATRWRCSASWRACCGRFARPGFPSKANTAGSFNMVYRRDMRTRTPHMRTRSGLLCLSHRLISSSTPRALFAHRESPNSQRQTQSVRAGTPLSPTPALSTCLNTQ